MAELDFPIISADRPLVMLGCGNMGRALLTGWRARGLPASHIFIIDPAVAAGIPELDIEASQVALATPSGLRAGLVMLAVKPQMMGNAVGGVAEAVDEDTALLSIMAGLPIAAIERQLPRNAGCVRTMPNTPAAIGKGVTALFAAPEVGDDIRGTCDALMQAAGQTVWVRNEADMNTVTAISGSGPAYVFHLIEALTQAGIKRGLDSDVAENLAIETVAGAGALAAHRTASPETLRVQVTSPKGTTEAGLSVLMDRQAGLMQLIDATVEAAQKRAQELSN